MEVLKLAGGTIAVEAQDWRPSRERHKDKFDLGDAIVGGLVVGGVLALVASGKKKSHGTEPAEERVPIDTGPVDGSRYGEMPPPASAPIVETPAPNAAEFDGLYDEDAAADRCALEAESLGERYARLAQVSTVTSTVWNGKSWVIKGRLDLADGYRDTTRESHGFRCALRRGSSPIVTIEGLQAL
jgi:hypothetical protein